MLAFASMAMHVWTMKRQNNFPGVSYQNDLYHGCYNLSNQIIQFEVKKYDIPYNRF